MIKDMEQSIQIKHNAAQSQEHIIAESSFPTITYDLEEYLNWIDSIPKSEVEEIQKNFFQTQLECYLKYSIGYIDRNFELKYNRSYDFPNNFVQWLKSKSESFSKQLKIKYCEDYIEKLQNLIEFFKLRSGEIKIKFPILQESVDIFYSDLIKKLKKYLEHYKRVRMTLEEDYKPKENQYSEQDIQTASEVDLSHLFEKKRRSGRNWIVLCPFHNEKTPSMVLFYKKGFHCYGCHKHGSSIDLYRHLNNCDFKTAVEDLLKLNF